MNVKDKNEMINNNRCNNDVILPVLEFTIKHDEFEKESYAHTRSQTVSDDEIWSN